MRSRTKIDSTRSGCSEEGRDYLSLKLDHPPSTRRFTRASSMMRVERSSLSRGGRENWLRTVANCPGRFDWSGLREDGQSRPRCAADEDRTDAIPAKRATARRFAPSRERHDSQQM